MPSYGAMGLSVRVVVATPCFGNKVNTQFVTSFLRARNACASRGIKLLDYLAGGRALITLLRSQMASAFLASDHDALLWIDADEGFHAEDVIAVTAGIAAGLPIVAAPYPLKTIDWEGVRQAALAGAPAEQLLAAGLTHVVAMNEDDIASTGYVGPRKRVGPYEFVRARRAGTGFMCISRRVFEAIAQGAQGDELRYRGPRDGGAPEIQHAFFQTPIEGERWAPEDYAFCELALRHGFEAWLWPNGRIAHIGDFSFEGAFDLDAHAKKLYEFRPSLRGERAPLSCDCPSKKE